ncbi:MULTISPECIES: cytochrome b [unclassified Hahella]|uniref:cytochrome b n=1 Tax=unclassified Hahella TaxID=2624107 RepID=UPI001C1EBB4E|nr:MULTISPECIES: cytochrome b [unclassified Hahella]MBU6953707.1 cytochrome b [Hahella sp. HN01]MDG9671539.1 cytochrome b [Hahella sp. CR1]
MWKNTQQNYGLIAILLHWLVALVVFGLFGLGLYMTDLSYYDAWYQKAPFIHKSIGMLLLFVIVFRLVWRFINVRPEPEASLSRIEKVASEWAHRLLYLLLIATMIAGYLISTADGRGIDVFGWFEIPALLPPVKGMEDIAGEIHEVLAWTLVGLAVLHALAAIKHHVIDKDKTLMRMFSPK